MKFEQIFSHAKSNDNFHCEDVLIIKSPQLGSCQACGGFTRWADVDREVYVCSEECMKIVREGKPSEQSLESFYSNHASEILDEIDVMQSAKDATKDILIVVRDQLHYLKCCIEAIRRHTSNYKLYIWDNASGPDVANYLASLMASYDEDFQIEVHTSNANIGFIKPNNELVKCGDGEYIILLNSDTVVSSGWDLAMIGHLQKYPDVAEVGYAGGLLDDNGKGNGSHFGYNVDFLSAWCVGFSRKIYEEHGLFNKQLTFAYCEDADFSLRLQVAGKKIYTLSIPLVYHYGNKTIRKVKTEGEVDVYATFEKNHEYMRVKWKNYLENDRVVLRHPELREKLRKE